MFRSLRKNFVYAILLIAIILFATSFIQMSVMKVQLAEINAKVSALTAFPASAAQTPARIDIVYNKNGKLYTIQTYDNMIDVGNETINLRILEAVMHYRNNNLLCPCHPPKIYINEKNGFAEIRINWTETMETFSVKL